MAVNLSPVGGVAAQFFNNDGTVLSGGLLNTYLAGTTTRVATYTTSAGTIAHLNPIQLNSAGRVPASGEVWLTDGITYKFVLTDANDVLIATYDNISGINSNFVNFTNSQEIQTATAGQTVFTLTTMQYQPGTGSLSVFVDGVNQYGPGAQYAFTETSATVVTFVTGLQVGASVKFTTSAINASSYGTASDISYTPAGTNAVITNVQAKLRQYVSVVDFGADATGVADSTNAIKAAIAASNSVYFPTGSYLVSSSIPITTPVYLYSEGSGFTYDANTGTGQTGATIKCGTVTGYLFTVALPLNTTRSGFNLRGLTFDGNASTTWNGLVIANPNASSSSSACANFTMSECAVVNSNTSAPLMDLSSFDRFQLTKSTFARFSNDAIYINYKTGGSVVTRCLIDTCEFVYGRQALNIFAALDLHLRDCSFEAITTVGAIFQATTQFSNCYFENVGQTWAGYTNGTINKSFGQSSGVAGLDTPIVSAINVMNANVNFISCGFNYLNAAALVANPLARYVFVNGKVSSIGTGCTVNFLNCGIPTSLGVAFFEQVATAQQSLAIYSWRGGLYSPQRLAYADLRLLTDSFLYVDFTGGANPAAPTTVQVQTGRFILESQNYAVPTAFPTGGQWVKGDRIYFLNVASGGYIGATCVTTGSPGSWTYFGSVI